MRLYRTRQGQVVGRKDKAGKGAEPLDVPTDKSGLIDWLNDNIPTAVNDNHPAFVLGRSDAERGMTTNPYASPDLRAEWERGHAYAVELGLADLPSFASISIPRDGKARRKIQRGRS